MMTTSLPGVLLRAAEACEHLPQSDHLGYPLRKLLDDLRELRENPAAVGEFFAAWSDEDYVSDRTGRECRRPACPACGGPTVDRGAAVWCERCRVKVESCCDGGDMRAEGRPGP